MHENIQHFLPDNGSGLWIGNPQHLSGERPRVWERARERGISQLIVVGDQIANSGLILADMIYAAAADPAVKIVWLNLAMFAAEVEFLSAVIPAITKAREIVDVYCYMVNGEGPSLFCAIACQVVFARSTAQVGWTSCFGPPEFVSEKIASKIAEVNSLIRENLAVGRPQVTSELWSRLEHGSVIGEQAAAMGIADNAFNAYLLPRLPIEVYP